MKKQILLVVAFSSLTASCTTLRDSSANPFNWFGSKPPAQTVTGPVPAATPDPRPLIARITALQLDRAPAGGIVYARGLPPTQGYYDAALVPLNRGRPVDGVLRYEFRASPPLAGTPVGTNRSREIVAGAEIPRAVLNATTSIEVIAAANRQSIRRR